MVCTAACRSFVWPLRIRNGSYLGHVYGLTWAWIGARERARLAGARWTVNAVDNTFEPEEERVEPIAGWRTGWRPASRRPLIFKSMPIKIEIVELVDDVLESTKAAERADPLPAGVLESGRE